MRLLKPVLLIGIYLLAAAAVYVAQLSSIPGIFLMMFGGMLWVSFILNVMLLHIVVNVLRGQFAKGWLALPILVYGAFLTFQVDQSSRISEKIRELDASNWVDPAIPRDVALIFDADSASRRFARAVKVHLVGARVFAGDDELDFMQQNPLKSDGCFSLTDTAVGRTSMGYIIDVDLGDGFEVPKGHHSAWCVVSQRSVVPPNGLHFHAAPELPESENASFELTIESVGKTPRRVGHFAYGTIRVVSQWPLFVLGCALNSAAPSWDCTYGPITKVRHYGVAREPLGFDWEGPRVAALAQLLGRNSRESTARW